MSKIEIESAFVEAWTKNTEDHPSWGMKTAEPHRRKNDAGEWETVGRTFRTVKVSRDSGIDLTRFRKGDRVLVAGREVTESREHDGKTYYDLVVWADRVEPVERGGTVDRPSQPVSQTNDTWSTPTFAADETPF
jgi:single-stranded DNA-binding protein